MTNASHESISLYGAGCLATGAKNSPLESLILQPFCSSSTIHGVPIGCSSRCSLPLSKLVYRLGQSAEGRPDLPSFHSRNLTWISSTPRALNIYLSILLNLFKHMGFIIAINHFIACAWYDIGKATDSRSWVREGGQRGVHDWDQNWLHAACTCIDMTLSVRCEPRHRNAHQCTGGRALH